MHVLSRKNKSFDLDFVVLFFSNTPTYPIRRVRLIKNSNIKAHIAQRCWSVGGPRQQFNVYGWDFFSVRILLCRVVVVEKKNDDARSFV